MTARKPSSKAISRRDFLKVGGLGVAGAVAAGVTGGLSSAQGSLSGKRMCMVIDLHRCVGCGACLITCKNENNVQGEHFWGSRISKTVGRFPNVRYEFIVTLCNHCENAPCVMACPVKAMYKGDGEITMHNPKKCIGCRYCMVSCPYDVISSNDEKPHAFWRDEKPLIEGITAAPAEVARKTGGKVIPYYNSARETASHESGLRFKGVVEKCTFCYHIVAKGELPYCVDACPANARIFGDMNDPDSEVNQILAKYRPWRLKEELGTKPKVFYVRSYNPGTYRNTKGSI